MEVVVPGPRDVRATLDRPTAAGEAGAEPGTEATTAVVACPPHPRMGGTRSDGRLRAVGDALTDRGVACLRFDYGPWDERRGERADARRAVAWTRERYDRVGLFGYSFGGCVAVLAAAAVADDGGPVAALSTLAAASRVGDGRDRDAAAALGRVDCPVQVVFGERDDTADWAPLVERARTLGCETVAVGADHHFVGQRERVADRVGEFLRDRLGVPPS
ncbi:alpha/beta hydrolase [Halobacteriales archaeon SW_5_70_135]|nr:MAG: alpha/beta hydrolase [Halobacteriales archaeon SW_5_70_135]